MHFLTEVGQLQFRLGVYHSSQAHVLDNMLEGYGWLFQIVVDDTPLYPSYARLRQVCQILLHDIDSLRVDSSLLVSRICSK